MKYKGIFIILFIFFSIIVLSGGSLFAEGTSGLDKGQYIGNFADITIEAGKSLIPDGPEGLKRNLVLTGLVSSSFLLDQGIRDFVQDNLYFGDNILSRTLYNLGNPDYILPGYLMAGSYSYLSRNRYLQDSLLLSFQSLLVTQFYTALFKSTIGRTRPRNSINNPFERGEGGRSFFSGHSSGAWAVMTVFAERYSAYSLPFYGVASSVAVSRIYEDAHWFSDILVGSLVGYGIGKLTVNLNQSFADKVLIVPVIEEELAGISLKFNF